MPKLSILGKFALNMGISCLSVLVESGDLSPTQRTDVAAGLSDLQKILADFNLG